MSTRKEHTMGVLYAPSNIQIVLSNHPESGMGFRLISAKINYSVPHQSSGEISGKFIVINSIYLLPYELDCKPTDVQFLTIEDLWKSDTDLLNINKITIESINDIKLQFSMFDSPPSDNVEIPGYLSFKKQKLIVKTLTGLNEIYFRFSCEEKNDMIDSVTGKFKNGTYATSLSDINLAPSGFAAVGRYALPNPMSARYVSVIMPPKGIQIWKGTVTPNHGQAGGGVEVYFPNGAQNLIGHSYIIPES